MRKSALTAYLLLALSPLSTAGQIYKWVDAQGVTHFDAQPPQDREAAKIVLPTAPSAPTQKAKPTEDAEQQVIDTKVKKQVAEQETKRKAYCENVRTGLAQLRNNPRVSENIDGERRRLTEEQRQTRIGEIQKSIEQNCQ